MPVRFRVDVDRVNGRAHFLELVVDIAVFQHQGLAAGTLLVDTNQHCHVVRAKRQVLIAELIVASLKASQNRSHLQVANVPASVSFAPEKAHFRENSVRCFGPPAATAC